MARLPGRLGLLLPGGPRRPGEIAWGPIGLAAATALLALLVYVAFKYFAR